MDIFSSVPRVLPSLIHSTLGAGSPPNHKSYLIGLPFFTVRSLIPSPMICGGTVKMGTINDSVDWANPIFTLDFIYY